MGSLHNFSANSYRNSWIKVKTINYLFNGKKCILNGVLKKWEGVFSIKLHFLFSRITECYFIILLIFMIIISKNLSIICLMEKRAY